MIEDFDWESANVSSLDWNSKDEFDWQNAKTLDEFLPTEEDWKLPAEEVFDWSSSGEPTMEKFLENFDIEKPGEAEKQEYPEPEKEKPKSDPYDSVYCDGEEAC